MVSAAVAASFSPLVGDSLETPNSSSNSSSFTAMPYGVPPKDYVSVGRRLFDRSRQRRSAGMAFGLSSSHVSCEGRQGLTGSALLDPYPHTSLLRIRFLHAMYNRGDPGTP